MHREKYVFVESRRSFWTTFLIGAGFMAAVDEIIFHQLLAWHHFYDQATPAISLLSDGLLHATELLALVAGFFMWADLRQRHELSAGYARAGFFLGLGGFQLFDGIVDHKLLRLHQIRYGVDLLPYDLTWNLAGLVLILIGTGLLYRAKKAIHSKSSDQNT
ncbi:DUF2243 domain-containing protein [Catalinimonas niigatensis]|uniref:DUF2243 domain-containing protein n=1 Tax=Catalinimonas niigatensis TaxID=1397264 RepID=UPI00266549B8|nr:DUF2243 domain-containing protein [Catalinimonas niigatensis]WPP50324.1 DUF2243 domain-containing protein [Catalinimonas niigatensis]